MIVNQHLYLEASRNNGAIPFDSSVDEKSSALILTSSQRKAFFARILDTLLLAAEIFSQPGSSLNALRAVIVFQNHWVSIHLMNVSRRRY